MSAVVHRFPCGCRIASNGESCSHVDAQVARTLGECIERENARTLAELNKSKVTPL